MPLTKQELLIPRYLCTGTQGKPIWPGSIWRGGDIIEESIRHGDLMYCDTDGPRYSDFPHLFRPMQWWEERQPEDMPEYVIDKFGKVKRVLDYNTEFMTVVFSLDDFEESLAHYLPATEHEYNEYQKQKDDL